MYLNMIYRIKTRIYSIIKYPFYKIIFKRFGKHSCIYKPDILLGTKNISISDHVSILPHARIEALSAYEEEKFHPEIIIGSNCGIGRMFHLESCQKVEIGHDVLMSENIYISDCSHDYHQIDCNISRQPLKCDVVAIGDYCFIGRNVCILPGVKLGKQCIVGANAVVTAGSYPDYSVIAGIPAKVIKCIHD